MTFARIVLPLLLLWVRPDRTAFECLEVRNPHNDSPHHYIQPSLISGRNQVLGVSGCHSRHG
jgi:hypothetical protein